MAALRTAFGDDDVVVAGLPQVLTIFEEVHDAQPVTTHPISGGADRAAIASLAAGSFDRIVLFTNSFGSAWAASRAGIRERWGYGGRARGLLLTRSVPRPSKSERGHHADFYRTLARRFDAAEGVDAPPRLAARAETLARAAAILRKAGVDPARPLAVFAPGAAYGHAKRWIPEHAADVAARLVRARGMQAVLVGAAGDRDTGRAIEFWLRAHAPREAGAIVNLIGRTDVRGLIGILGHASIAVANDSGGAHISAAMGVPTLTIFGPTDERGSAPIGPGEAVTHDVFCRPCMLRDCPIDHRCMKRITADTVFARAEALL
jgi:heptosyltransferase-2